MLLLVPETISILGGSVDYINTAKKRALEAFKKPSRKERSNCILRAINAVVEVSHNKYTEDDMAWNDTREREPQELAVEGYQSKPLNSIVDMVSREETETLTNSYTDPINMAICQDASALISATHNPKETLRKNIDSLQRIHAQPTVLALSDTRELIDLTDTDDETEQGKVEESPLNSSYSNMVMTY